MTKSTEFLPGIFTVETVETGNEPYVSYNNLFGSMMKNINEGQVHYVSYGDRNIRSVETEVVTETFQTSKDIMTAALNASCEVNASKLRKQKT